MEDFEMLVKAAKLGNELIEALQPEIYGNTKVQWVVQYIAEQIVRGETAEGTERASAHERCLGAVLVLRRMRADQRRWGWQPLTNLDPILREITRLETG